MGQPTLLRSLTGLRHLTSYDSFKTQFENAARRVAERDQDEAVAKVTVAERTFERWLAGQVKTKPQPRTCRVLEEMFGHTVDELLSAARAEPEAGRQAEPVTGQPGDMIGTIEEMLTMATQRARQFSARAEETNIGDTGLALLHDEAAAIARIYPFTPVTEVAARIAALESDTFTLLEQAKLGTPVQDLHTIAALAGGMMAKAFHDLRNPHDAMTHAQVAVLNAQLARNDTMSAWIRGIESLIAFWAGRHAAADEYATAGLAIPGQAGTVQVWLHSLSARARAALGDAPAALAEVQAAETAREHVVPDSLDAIGGMCEFEPERQSYYAADAGTLIPPNMAGTQLGRAAEQHARDAIAGYAASPSPAFGDQAGAHVAFAVAQIRGGSLDGAAETLTPVLNLPAPMRINGVKACVMTAHRELSAAAPRAAEARQLQRDIEEFTLARAVAAL